VSQAPRVLTVAGFDPSGRAGLLADTWAIASAGGAALAVVTALTAQGTQFVCQPVAPKLIAQQLRSALASGPVRAAKLGMVPHRRALAAISAGLREGTFPIVIDPVVRTSKGERLSSLTAADYLQLGAHLGLHHPLILTPNREELRWLGASPTDLLRSGFWGVVVKGSDSAIDEVFTRKAHQLLRGSRLPRNTSHHRGTGCRFGSGLAASLARGEDLFRAARSAKRLVRKFLRGPILP
jgi:hydroxymethylpyrimidine/phosphomethylpyrimidine kinase